MKTVFDVTMDNWDLKKKINLVINPVVSKKSIIIELISSGQPLNSQKTAGFCLLQFVISLKADYDSNELMSQIVCKLLVVIFF